MEMDARYYPCNLSIYSDNSLSELVNGADSLFLSFSNTIFCGEKPYTSYYKILINKYWFKSSFVVLKVYDLANRKYRKQFFALPNTNYTYEVNFEDYSMIRVRKKLPKKKCP